MLSRGSRGSLASASSFLRRHLTTNVEDDLSDDFEDVDSEPSRNDDVAIHDDDFE